MKYSNTEIILGMRAEGATFREIGKRVGLSGQQCRNIIKREMEKLSDKTWSAGLSTRTKNCMSRLGVLSRAHAEKLLMDGMIQPNKVAGNHIKIRGFGKRSYSELCNWLGVKTTPPRRCAHCGQIITTN